ncbi:hypothetical protein BDV98DRAFT_225469 [Pterulicium gracile]|uniref:F-box domain-containing protein n=1 Tax=Pterulicium gracile TaxID=1884261 RepID=A0A5C3QUA0_9AGAR|nr:hypothetical protein BDV98DRAFT_225469 [Pterula gracilis]
MFMQAPKLEALHLTHLDLDTLNFPWHQLTTLLLGHVNTGMDHIQQVLSHCTALYDLELRRCNIEGERAPPNTSISLPRLETLLYEAHDNDAGLLRSLHIPALEELTLTTSVSLQELRICLLLSKPPLTKLRFRQNFWFQDAATMTDVLRMVPTLEHLSMDFPRGGAFFDTYELDVILTSLDYRGPHQLCPRLSSLTLRQATFSDRSADLFIKMLASRSIEGYVTTLPNTVEQFNGLTPDIPDRNAEEAHLADPRGDELLKDSRGSEAALSDLTITFAKGRRMKDCFSAAQLNGIKVLTGGMYFPTSSSDSDSE